MSQEFWREQQVREATKLSRSTRWRLESQGDFPARRQLSPNTVGWLRADVEAWIEQRAPVADQPTNQQKLAATIRRKTLEGSLPIADDQSIKRNLRQSESDTRPNLEKSQRQSRR